MGVEIIIRSFLTIQLATNPRMGYFPFHKEDNFCEFNLGKPSAERSSNYVRIFAAWRLTLKQPMKKLRMMYNQDLKTNMERLSSPVFKATKKI